MISNCTHGPYLRSTIFEMSLTHGPCLRPPILGMSHTHGPLPMLPMLKYSPPMGYPFVKHEVNIEHPLQTCYDLVVDELYTTLNPPNPLHTTYAKSSNIIPKEVGNVSDYSVLR